MGLKIVGIQASTVWEDKEVNFQNFEQTITSLENDVDLIVLPEMFSTGFSMQSVKLAETMDGPTVSWMKNMAATTNATCTGSFICVDKGKYYNRLLWAGPDGKISWYDKRHLFGYADENQFYTAGTEKKIFSIGKWKICPLICYDLRFPVWSRNTDRYDLLIYIANWPVTRAEHWKTLLKARAIENQCYVAGVNIVGEDGNGFQYSGDSAVIDFNGSVMEQHSLNPCVIQVDLDLEILYEYRNRLQFLQDQDKFEMTPNS